jgi:peptidyl-prolyl cis-trans isomerase C
MKPSISSLRMSLSWALLVFLSHCSKQSVERADVVARVGEVELTTEEMAQGLAKRAAQSPVPVKAREWLDEWVEREVLVQKATQAGLLEDAEVRERLRDVLIARFKELQIDPLLEAIDISDEEMLAAYEARKERFKIPERIRLAVLFQAVHPEAGDEEAKQARQRLEAAMGDLKKSDSGAAAGRGFGVMAVSYSEDQETRYRGGEIGWVERDRYPPRIDKPVIEAGFALQTLGQVSGVVVGEKGLYLVQLLERQAEAFSPYEQVLPALKNQLLSEKRERIQSELAADVRKGLTVEIFPERLSNLQEKTDHESLLPPSAP